MLIDVLGPTGISGREGQFDHEGVQVDIAPLFDASQTTSSLTIQRPHDETSDVAHLSPAASSSSFPGESSSWILGDPFAADFGSEDASLHLTSPTVAKAVDSYFQYCHRQPIWCFDYEDLEGMGFLSKE